jgi:HAE1 family hydrophobic/amphiphilic exporter-1
VFVPVAFIPGISGQLFRQFAVAVSISMLISAVNALTLSPALCSVLLTRGGRRRGLMRYVLGAIDRTRDGYVSVVQRLVRVAVFGVVAVAVATLASFALYRTTPQGFLPAETRARSLARYGCRRAPRCTRTEELVAQVENTVRRVPGVQGIISVVGSISSITSPLRTRRFLWFAEAL